MTKFSTRLKLIPEAGGHDVYCSVKHPVIKNSPYSTWYIRSMTFYVNGNVAAGFQLGPHVSRDPLIGTHLTGLNFGDRVSVEWIDTRSNRGKAVAYVQ